MALLPPIRVGAELVDGLANYPGYEDDIQNRPAQERLVALSDLYNLYIPSQMSLEIYHKMYTALLCSMRKKQTKKAVRQQYQNRLLIDGGAYHSIIGGADSFTILGTSGIGKSMAVSRAISLISENRIVKVSNPFLQIIPCLVVQCPFDCSVKGLLLEILRKVDAILDSSYCLHISSRVTTDMLIGSVSQVALNHIGLLIVDEIQNVVTNKSGHNLIGVLTQLINNSGISVGMIGTPDCKEFFESAPQLARRSVGLQYQAMEYDSYFISFCKVLFQYQYTKKHVVLTDVMAEWLYEHSAGITSVVVSLIHDAQEIAIHSGVELLDFNVLQQAYQNRLSLLHSYINPGSKRKTVASIPPKADVKVKKALPIPDDDISIEALQQAAKRQQLDVLCLIRGHFPITEVSI